MNFPTVIARRINLASVVYKKNTALPILAEIVEDVVKASYTSKSSDKRVCSQFVGTENHCSKCMEFF